MPNWANSGIAQTHIEVMRMDLLEAQWNWRVWKELFAPEPTDEAMQRMQLLNKTAPSVFKMLHRVLAHSVMLELCKLTDPPLSSGKPNLSIEAELVRREALGTDQTAARAKLLKVVGREKPSVIIGTVSAIRMQRKKLLAHSDRDTKLGIAGIADVQISDIDAGLAGVRELIMDLDPDQASFQYELDSTDDGVSLVNTMKFADTYLDIARGFGYNPMTWKPACAHCRRTLPLNSDREKGHSRENAMNEYQFTVIEEGGDLVSIGTGLKCDMEPNQKYYPLETRFKGSKAYDVYLRYKNYSGFPLNLYVSTPEGKWVSLGHGFMTNVAVELHSELELAKLRFEFSFISQD